MLVKKWPPVPFVQSRVQTDRRYVQRYHQESAYEARGILAGVPKYWVIREPWSRFKSFYRQKIILPGGLIDKHRVYDRILKGMSVEELFKYIEYHPNDNAHWESQVNHIGRIPEVRPIPFERYTEFLLRIGFREDEILYLNPNPKSDFNDWPKGMKERVRELYSEDYKLWEEAINAGDNYFPG